MRPPLTFFCAGLPVATPRVKASRHGGFIRMYTPPVADDWKMIVRNEARRAWNESEAPNIARPWQGPLCVNLTFYFPRPKAHFNSKGELKPGAPKWHTSKPDRDNADKAVLDALTNLGILGDDKQVCDGRIRKLYIGSDFFSRDNPTQQMGCQIEIKECENL